MNVQVTIRIDRAAITEMAEVFRQIIGVAPNGQQAAVQQPAPLSQSVPAVQESVPAMQQPVLAAQQSGPAIQQPVLAAQSVLAAQESVPAMQQPVPGSQPEVQAPPAQPGGQAFSSQIAQKTQLPVQTMAGAAVPVQSPPTTAVAQEYTQDQMAVALTGLIDAGRRDAVTQILGAFGVRALTQIPKERYPELVLKLREAGANI